MTEFVNADGLQSKGHEPLLKYLRFTEEETPIIAQIWGNIPENYYKTAKELVKMGFAGIDINMGCPDKTIVKNGSCAALINNRELAKEIIQAAKEGAGSLPVSVKTRLGFNDIDLSWHEFLLNQKLNALSIHARTKKEMSKVPPHWDVINQIRETRDRLSPTTTIIGNGDVMNRAEGMELAKKYQLEGIMIGRGIFHDPFAFATQSPWEDYTKEQRLKLYRRHVELFAQEWQNGERKIPTLNKFCKIYINGFDGAKELREKFMAAKTVDELLNLLAV
jgi:tRNA-dihydrouridine synthase